MTLFDTAGMERHMSTIPHTYFRGAKMLLVVYSIDDTETFDSIDSWLDNASSARVAAGEDRPIIALVGNKLDLDSSRAVYQSRANELADLYEIPSDLIFEVSAKENTNVQGLFDAIATKMKPDIVQSRVSPAENPSRKKLCLVI